MYRVLVLFTICLVAVYAQPTEDEKKCMRLLHHGGRHCCVKDISIKLEYDESLKECMQLPKTASACERDICIAVKRGIASEDGKLDIEALKARVEKDMDDQDLAKSIVDNCVNGDLSKYGPADMCDVMRLKLCMDVQYIASCPEWDNEGPCMGTKELASECLKKFA